MASVVASNVVNRVFGWVMQKNIRLVFDASLLRNIKEKEQKLAGSKPHIISLKSLTYGAMNVYGFCICSGQNVNSLAKST